MTIRQIQPGASLLRIETVEHASPLGRWKMTVAAPEGPLAAWVETLWHVEGEASYSREQILPRGNVEVLFNLGEAHRLLDPRFPAESRVFDTCWVSGQQQGPLWIESPRRSAIAGFRMRPAGALPFFGLPPEEISLQVIDLDLVLGRGMRRLWHQVADEPDASGVLVRLAREISARALAGPAVSARVGYGLAALAASDGNLRLEKLVREVGWSHRHFAERFRREVGLAPKAYARILRFGGALRRLQGVQRVSWADFAAEYGYYDQAHLARDFRALAGATPTELLRQLSPDGIALMDA